MFSLEEQFIIISKFLIFINGNPVKDVPISLIKNDKDSNCIIFFDRSIETEDEYYEKLIDLSLTSEYTVIYVPDNTKGYVRVFLEFLDPKGKKYTKWILSNNGNLIPYDEDDDDVLQTKH